MCLRFDVCQFTNGTSYVGSILTLTASRPWFRERLPVDSSSMRIEVRLRQHVPDQDPRETFRDRGPGEAPLPRHRRPHLVKGRWVDFFGKKIAISFPLARAAIGRKGGGAVRRLSPGASMVFGRARTADAPRPESMDRRTKRPGREETPFARRKKELGLRPKASGRGPKGCGE